MNLSIGQLSTLTGEPVKTLRYWTDRGLLQARRGENGYRLYDSSTPSLVAFIRSAQGLGFRLEVIARLIAVENQGPEPCQAVTQEMTQHLAWVRQQIEQLKAIETKLENQLQQNDTCHGLGYCEFLPLRA